MVHYYFGRLSAVVAASERGPATRRTGARSPAAGRTSHRSDARRAGASRRSIGRRLARGRSRLGPREREPRGRGEGDPEAERGPRGARDPEGETISSSAGCLPVSNSGWSSGRPGSSPVDLGIDRRSGIAETRLRTSYRCSTVRANGGSSPPSTQSSRNVSTGRVATAKPSRCSRWQPKRATTTTS